MRQPFPWPREHGAWGLLVQPFLAAAIVAGVWTWLLLPAFALALCGLLLKEPLLIWLRSRWIWHKPDTTGAAVWAGVVIAAIALCLAALGTRFPPLALAVIVSGGGAFTALAVIAALNNRQRSVSLQMLNAAALTATSLLAAYTATLTIARWAWLLWALFAVHAVASIPVVHARLEMRARKPTAQHRKRWAAGLQIAVLCGAALLVVLAAPLRLPWVWMAAAFPAAVNLVELRRLSAPHALNEPLKAVGQRLLAFSIIHTLLVIAVVKAAQLPL